MIHPGEDQEYWDKWKEGDYIAIGWSELDITENNLIDQIEKKRPNDNPSHIKSQFEKFVEEMTIGDIVLVCGNNQVLKVGKVLTEVYVEGEDDIHRRDVEWLTQESIDISDFPEDFYNKATHQHTILEFTEKSNIDLIKGRILKDHLENGFSDKEKMVEKYKESRDLGEISNQIKRNSRAVKTLARSILEEGKIGTEELSALYFLCLIDHKYSSEEKKRMIDDLDISEDVKDEVKEYIDEDTGIVGGPAFQLQIENEEEKAAVRDLLETVLTTEDGDELLQAVDNFASKEIYGIQSTKLSPILFMLRPTIFPINNNLSREGMEKYFGKEISGYLEDYKNEAERYKEIRDKYNFQDNFRDLDYFFIWANQNLEESVDRDGDYSIQEILDKVFLNEEDAAHGREYFVKLIDYFAAPEKVDKDVLNSTFQEKRNKISINCGSWQLFNIERSGQDYKSAFAVDTTELPQDYKDWSEFIEHVNTFDAGEDFALERFKWKENLLAKHPELEQAWKSAIHFASENWEKSRYQKFHRPEIYDWIMDGFHDSGTKNYFWVTADPDTWNVSNIKDGGQVFYTATNRKGNKRRVFDAFKKVCIQLPSATVKLSVVPQ